MNCGLIINVEVSRSSTRNSMMCGLMRWFLDELHQLPSLFKEKERTHLSKVQFFTGMNECGNLEKAHSCSCTMSEMKPAFAVHELNNECQLNPTIRLPRLELLELDQVTLVWKSYVFGLQLPGSRKQHVGYRIFIIIGKTKQNRFFFNLWIAESKKSIHFSGFSL